MEDPANLNEEPLEDKGDDLAERASTASLKSNSVYSVFDEEEKPIDDDEFGIPPLDFEPTLESILSEDNQLTVSDDEVEIPEVVNINTAVSGSSDRIIGLLPEHSDTVSIASRGSNDTRSRTSNRSSRLKSQQTLKKKPTSILRHVLLKSMTSDLVSAMDKLDSGTATAVAMGNLIAIGTSHGYVLMFDSNQILKWYFGESAFRDEGGSVSSLAMNGNGGRLLVGYAKGLILMYDTDSGNLIRTLREVHAPATAVLMLHFTDDSSLALCSDSGGSVFELNFKRTMGVRGCDSRCIFSGSRGEVCSFEPLLLTDYPDNPLRKFIIVALVTLSKVLVVILRPKLKVVFTHALISDPTSLPIVCWQMVIIQTSSDKIVDPVLTFARDSGMYFYQMTMNSKNAVHLIPLQKVDVNYQLLGIHWLNSRTISLLDTKECLHVLDVRSQEELEVIDLSQVRLVYANSHFKGLATGGNVSRAFALAGEHACYNSIVCFNNQMIVLGTKSVHALTMRSWHERLDYLVKQQHFKEALQLGYELYLEKAKAIIGLKGSRDSKKLIVREKMLYILDKYIARIPSLPLDDLNTAKLNYLETITCAMNYCVLLDSTSTIFDKLFSLCSSNPICHTVYLEALEPFILNDQLPLIPPEIVKELLSHIEELGNYQSFQACVVHINVASLDLHHVIKLCWTQGLYDAIIYIYNRGMMDYVAPFEELMTVLQNSLDAENHLSSSQIALGNKILVYISSCMSGRAYPCGDIPKNLVEKVQSDIIRCLTTLHTRNSPENEPVYPYLRCLLKFDTKEFFNVLSLSFEEQVFQSELGKRQKQRIVDILLQIMVEQDDFTPSQVGTLFTFLARQVAKPNSALYVSKQLFEQVLEHLTSCKDSCYGDERQEALIELLQAGGIQHFDYQKLLEKCRSARFFRVCELLYERREEYTKIFECYLQDPSRQSQIFSYIHKIFCVYPSRKEEFQTSTKLHIHELVTVDNKKTAQLAYMHCASLVPELVNYLEENPEKQYLFLQGIFAMRDQNLGAVNIDTVISEKYINLMAKYNPQLVCSVLKTIDTYRPDAVMQICEANNLVEAVSYLLEKEGKIIPAFEKLRDVFQTKLLLVIKDLEISTDNFTSLLSWSQLQAFFLVIIQFSQRNSSKLISEEREQIWLPVFELVVNAHNKFQRVESVCIAFNDMAKHLISSMMGHVSLTTIVEIIMNDPSYQSATFAEVRDLMMGMLETCTYEDMLVSLIKRVSQSDVHAKLKTKVKATKKAFSPTNRLCIICHLPVSGNNDLTDPDVFIYHCGHSYHKLCKEEKRLLKCTVCQTRSTESRKKYIQNSNFEIPEISHKPIYAEENTEDNNIYDSQFELKLEARFKVDLHDV